MARRALSSLPGSVVVVLKALDLVLHLGAAPVRCGRLDEVGVDLDIVLTALGLGAAHLGRHQRGRLGAAPVRCGRLLVDQAGASASVVVYCTMLAA